MAKKAHNLGDLTATGAGTEFFGDIDGGTLIIQGTFVATVIVECTADGTVWVPMGSPELVAFTTTVPVSFPVFGRVAGIRVNVTAFTSGTVAARYYGLARTP